MPEGSLSGATGLLLAALLIVLNGLFVAAEFSLASLRRSSLEPQLEAGERRARTVARELDDLPSALSAAQFGITATSLLLGFIAERAIGDTLVRPVLERFGLPGGASLAVTIGVAFVLATVTQMVLGELFPKNLAISRPLGVAMTVTPVTRALGLLFGPVIRVFDRAAQRVTRSVFRVEVAPPVDVGHSLDELSRIVSASGEEGSLSGAQTALLTRAIELGEVRAGQVMVPRPDVVWLTDRDTLADLRELARRTGFSRFPVHGATEDDVLGTVHVKDLLGRDRREQASTAIAAVVQPAAIVPEPQPLRRLLADLRRQHRTFAVVVDEFGGTAGIVTVEDVLEVLVGDIRDEFDPGAAAPVTRVAAGRHVVGGAVRVEQLARLVGDPVPDGPYETVAGFVLDRLGRIAEVGDAVVEPTAAGQVRFTVTGVDGVRITEVTVEVPPPPADDGPEVQP